MFIYLYIICMFICLLYKINCFIYCLISLRFHSKHKNNSLSIFCLNKHLQAKWFLRARSYHQIPLLQILQCSLIIIMCLSVYVGHINTTPRSCYYYPQNIQCYYVCLGAMSQENRSQKGARKKVAQPHLLSFHASHGVWLHHCITVLTLTLY